MGPYEPAATVALTDLLLVVGLLSAGVLLTSAAVIRGRRRWRRRRHEKSFRDALNPELRGVLDEFVR
jgi:hypothetical protein